MAFQGRPSRVSATATALEGHRTKPNRLRLGRVIEYRGPVALAVAGPGSTKLSSRRIPRRPDPFSARPERILDSCPTHPHRSDDGCDTQGWLDVSAAG